VRFVPGNPSVVHHAILFRVEPDQVSAARAKDRQDKGRGWSCFGGPGLPSATGFGLDSAPWLAAWAPGGTEQRFGRGTGVRLPKGGRAVLQVHYNLRGGKGSDSTKVELRTRSGSADLAPLETMLLPAPVELPCAKGESGPLCDRNASIFDTIQRFGESEGRVIAGLQLLCGGDPTAPRAGRTQSCDRDVLSPMTIRAAAGHMHLLGRSIRIDLNPDTPNARTILNVRQWDFDEQGARPLTRPVRVGPGDVLRVTCTHDPSLRAVLPALQDTPPRYVTWGEGTTDEMCLGILSFTRT
jgi:Copper type II ascorbate-dependent monooxygenase, C-terminal domain